VDSPSALSDIRWSLDAVESPRTSTVWSFFLSAPFSMAGGMQLTDCMSPRVRHCVECPKCHVCYLIAFSPYSNGAFLVPTAAGVSEEYTLYCFCGGAQFPNTWKWREVKVCEVSKEAHYRGFGTLDEVWQLTRQPQHEAWFDINRYVDLKPS
jgi:hypothetical protein